MAGQVISKVVAGDGSKNLIANSFYGTCATVSGTAAKEVIINDPDIVSAITPVPGTMLTVKFDVYNGVSSPTLTLYNNAGSTTTPSKGTTTLLASKAVHQVAGTAASTNAATSWRSNAIVPFVYDGTRWVECSSIDNNTTYTSVSLGNGFGTSSSTATATTKAVTLSSYALVSGGRISVLFSNANTVDGTIKLNVNSKGEKNVYVNNSITTATSNPLFWDAGAMLEFVYDGTQYQCVSAPISTSEITSILTS